MEHRERKDRILLPAILLCLLPWLGAQMNTYLNADHSMLLIGMERLLNGGSMGVDDYNPNLPLSWLIYLPVIALHRWLGIPEYAAPYVFGVICLALSALAVWKLLRLWPGLDYARRAIILAGFLAGSTYLPGNFYFAERDALVVWGLFPFMLAQLALTRGEKISGFLLYPVLILGAWAILIKPFYGLFPTLLLLHRMHRQKRFFSIVRDSDFLALAASVVVYGIVLLVFFRPFFEIVLPDMMSLYVARRNPNTLTWWIMIAGIIAAAGLCTALTDLPKDRAKPIYLFLLAGFISSAFFLLQEKGIFYHLIPTMVFLWCAAGLFIHALLRRYIGEKRAVDIAAAVCTVLFAALLAPQPGNAVTHEDYKKLKMPQLVKDCAPECSFFVIGETMEMIHQVTIYTGAPHASRYAGLWWFWPLYEAGKEEELNRHIGNVAEDLRRWRPRIMAVITNIAVGDEKNFDFIGYMSRNPAFREEMSHYRKTGVMEDNRRDYFLRTAFDFDFPLVYDLYERVDD